MAEKGSPPLPSYTTGKTAQHNAMTLRAPPGARFTFAPGGADVILQFPRGQEKEVIEYLHKWLDSFGEYELKREHPALKAQIEGNPRITSTSESESESKGE